MAQLQPDWNPQKIRMGHKVMGALKQTHFSSERRRVAKKQDNRHDTSEGVMDARTRDMLFRWQQAGVIGAMHGVLSTGKEANVYHATAGPEAEKHDTAGCGWHCEEFALKVFRTTLNEFANRGDYMEDDWRYQRRKMNKQNPRKFVKLWAEKERNNLLRVRHVGLRVPMPLQLREHILRMEFLGSDRTPAPKLKDALSGASQGRAETLYVECCAMIRTMWEDAKLVHGDLSDYNILVHDKKPWFIDVAQAVVVDSKNSSKVVEWLNRDCENLTACFARSGVVCASAEDLSAWVQCGQGASLPAGSMGDLEQALDHVWETKLHIVEEWVTKVAPTFMEDSEAFEDSSEEEAELETTEDEDGDGDDVVELPPCGSSTFAT